MNHKLITRILLIVLCLFLVACGASSQEDVTESIAVEETSGGRAEPLTDKSAGEASDAMQEAEVFVTVEVEREVEVEMMVDESAEEPAYDVAESSISQAAAESDDRAEPATSKATIQPQPTQTAAQSANEQAMAEEEQPRMEVVVQEGRKNPFIDTRDDNLSTFAIDVDTGAYTLMRSYLEEYGSLPPQGLVRVEEFVNYFDHQYPQPTEGAFAVHIEAAPAPYGESSAYHLMRVGVQGVDVSAETRPDVMLIFVIDVSGSMASEGQLDLVKESLRMLVDNLYITDRVGIVVYGSSARTVLNPTYVEDRFEILNAIEGLRTEGSTNAEAGIELGYSLANKYALDGEESRLIVLSDGVANVGQTTSDAILEHARRGISLSTFGFGLGSYNDGLMEQLANDGDGVYAYIDTLREAQRVFVHELTGTLITIAKDAKIQIEFNPSVVEEYRLIGYENRAVADSDFRNDRVDAGEIGSGHSVTALYEVRLAPDADPAANAMVARMRYQDLDSGAVDELAVAIAPSDFAQSMADTSPTFQLAAVVAEYGEILSGSYWASGNSLDAVYEDIDQVARMFPRDNQVQHFASLSELAARIGR